MSGLRGHPERTKAAAQVFVADPAAPLLDDEAAHHLGRVLRLRDGERVVASDGRGRWTLCRWRNAPAGVDVDGDVVIDPAPEPPLAVGFCPVKAERPELTVQRLTELGVDRIHLLRSDRGVLQFDAAREARVLARCRRIVFEAAAQSRRVHVPEVTGLTDVGDLLGEPGVGLAVPGGGPLEASIRTILVGPEGGWSSRELAVAAEVPLVGLAGSVLRAETAALAAAALLGALREGLLGLAGGDGARTLPGAVER